jgi:hypothetical protein
MPQRNSMTDRAFRTARWRRARWDEWNEGARTPPAAAPVKRSRRLAVTTTLVLCFMLGAALSAGAGDTVAPLAEGTSAPPATDAIPPADAPVTGAPVEPASEPAMTPEPVPEEASALSAPPLDEPVAEPEVASAPAVAPATAPPEPQPASAPVAAVPEPQPEPAPLAPAPERVSADPDMPHRVQTLPRAQPQPKAKPHQKRRPKRKAQADTKWHSRPEPMLRTQTRPARIGSELEPEAEAPGVDATVWLHRSMPDPTPPSKRLSRAFAHTLRGVARTSQVDWALMLALLRTEGRTGAAPASAEGLQALASRLSELRGQDQRSVALALAGDSERADRALALAHYHRAVGLRALVRGLEWAKPRLEARLLRDDRVATYEGGRSDVESGRVDVRVLVLIAYLADMYGDVTVSSLKTGHRLYSRPGVISAHVYGLAVDISALGGLPIAGNQEPGGLTEDAVRNIMLLPSELMPRQIISLLGLGGPSFPLGDHGDHIHVGY